MLRWPHLPERDTTHSHVGEGRQRKHQEFMRTASFQTQKAGFTAKKLNSENGDAGRLVACVAMERGCICQRILKKCLVYYTTLCMLQENRTQTEKKKLKIYYMKTHII